MHFITLPCILSCHRLYHHCFMHDMIHLFISHAIIYTISCTLLFYHVYCYTTCLSCMLLSYHACYVATVEAAIHHAFLQLTMHAKTTMYTIELLWKLLHMHYHTTMDFMIPLCMLYYYVGYQLIIKCRISSYLLLY